ncbi:hypothetical protein [Malonomonas rubra]|uniref:hypothetical protein n=1 Tax=Malonomonas rubra TaxID=57040 RepID=UPI0026F2F6B9|nr:hypothetical protein [Malonomonas rubra]
MVNILKVIVFGFGILLGVSLAARGEEIPGERFKGLDEQVQEIKSDVLSIAAELNQLEEKLLYPSNTQLAIFVSLAEGETFRLDAVELRLDGDKVTRHLYTYKELEALRKGGVQRLYTGNVRIGKHQLELVYQGKSSGGSDFRQEEAFTVEKETGPGIVEITLAKSEITFRKE